jgi:hypothetical protein
MGSDWDYINEHMGGHDEDGLPNFMRSFGFGEKFKNDIDYFDFQSTTESVDYKSLSIKYKLSKEETDQIKKYISIYSEHDFKSQNSANNYITKSKRWDEFPDIRSLNDHGSYANIPGILPKFYRITCEILRIERGGGAQLIKATKY